MPPQSQETHETDHREFRKFMIEIQANVRFVKWAASVGAVGLVVRFIA